MKISIGKMFGNVAGRLHLYQFCSKIGIESIFYRMCYKNELKTSDKFYSRNESRIQNSVNMFTEEESRRVYLKAIDFRRTHRLKDRPQFCKEKEYFNHLTNLSTNEVLVDCGAYTGDTVEEFVLQCKGCYQKIIAFEPDHANFVKLYDSCIGRKNCLCYEVGVWNKNDSISFEDGKLAGSRVVKEGREGVKISVVALDQCAECRDATFIKMDIEGAELMALQGAQQVITRNRPILTICLYHTDEDMLSIPEWMRKNLVDYRYYCRHHSYYKEDTIIYAIPLERC